MLKNVSGLKRETCDMIVFTLEENDSPVQISLVNSVTENRPLGEELEPVEYGKNTFEPKPTFFKGISQDIE